MVLRERTKTRERLERQSAKKAIATQIRSDRLAKLEKRAERNEAPEKKQFPGPDMEYVQPKAGSSDSALRQSLSLPAAPPPINPDTVSLIEYADDSGCSPDEVPGQVDQGHDHSNMEVDAALELASEAQANASLANQRADDFAKIAKSLRINVAWLEQRVMQLEAQLGDAKIVEEFPDNWNQLEAWTEQRFGSRVYLHPNAARAARKSVFADIPFAYEVIHFLGTVYQPLRKIGGEDLRRRLFEISSALRVDISPVGLATDNHRTQDAYAVTYKGRRRYAEMHVKGSSHRNRTRGFRLYFFYDQDDDMVVITHLPTHLDNRGT